MKSAVTLSLLVSSFHLVMVMVAGEDIHTDPMTAAEETIISNSASVTAYWHAMLPNAPMPSAILELLTPPDGSGDLGKYDNNNIRIVVKGTGQNNIEASFSNARKLGLHYTKYKNSKKNLGNDLAKETHDIKVPSAKNVELKTENFRLDPATNDQKTAYFRWGPATNDERTAYFRWGPATNDQRTAYFRWGPATNDQRTAYFRWGPGSKEMFAPASHAMARDIWSTLDICEHLRPVKGEKKTCVTCVESMVEFAASVVAGGNTRDLRVFSSPDVPAEGVTSGRRYKVAASRVVTEAGDTVTCHNMKFPVAAYMCHAVNPTKVHTVALESVDVAGAGEAGQRMEALAVCHLDTSEFGAMTMPEHVKPGDAPLCHFISRDSVLWARSAPAAAA